MPPYCNCPDNKEGEGSRRGLGDRDSPACQPRTCPRQPWQPRQPRQPWQPWQTCTWPRHQPNSSPSLPFQRVWLQPQKTSSCSLRWPDKCNGKLVAYNVGKTILETNWKPQVLPMERLSSQILWQFWWTSTTTRRPVSWKNTSWRGTTRGVKKHQSSSVVKSSHVSLWMFSAINQIYCVNSFC